MIRSLYSGVAGLRNHQIRMDVVGNNIANVNTTGYKSSRTNFQDAISQEIKSASSSPSINPSQIGTGIKVGGISTNAGQGPLQGTGRTLDVAIQGSGYFTLRLPSDDGSGSDLFYTREGTLFLTTSGDLVNSDGYKVCNSDGEAINLGTDVDTIAIDQAGGISVNGNPPDTDAYIGITKFNNPEGLGRIGGNLYTTTPASGTASTEKADGKETTINSGYLEMSNVDLTEEFTTMITTQRGYQANSRVITVSDTLLEELINLKR